MRISEEKLDQVAKELADIANTDMLDTFVALGELCIPYTGENKLIDDVFEQTKELERQYNDFTKPWEDLIKLFTEQIPEFAAHFNKYQVEETKKAANEAHFKKPVLPSLT